MARYDRETKHYDRNVLAAMVAAGEATYFTAPDIYVVKTEEGTFAVRPHQIIDTALITVLNSDRYQPITDVDVITAPSPMDGYCGKEQYDGEDTGPGGVVYDSALALAEEAVAIFGGDPQGFLRRILDDEDGEYVWGLRESMEDHVRAGRPVQPKLARRRAEQGDLLKHFGI